MTATMTIIMMVEATIIIGLFSLSSTTGFGSTSVTIGSSRSIIFRNDVVNINALSSSANDDEDEINDLIKTMKTNTGTNTKPDTVTNTNKDTNTDDSKSVTPDIQNDDDDTPDFMSVHDVDWAEMDPLNDIQFNEYESMYLQGKAAAESNEKFNTMKLENPNCDSSHESVMTEWLDSVPTLNHISVVGRVGSPPDARYFDNPIDGGKPNVVVKMSLALPRYYSAWEREQYGIEYGQEETEWYNLEIWGALAEFAVKNIEKGARIGVVGAIDTDYYPNKDTGLLSTNPKLLVQDIDILESKMEADARRNKNNNSNYGNNNNNNSYSGGGGYGGGGGGGGGNSNPNRNYNNNSNNNNYGNGNGNGGQQQRQQERGPSFYTADNDNDDDDDDDDDMYDPSRGGGSAGGFFDPM